MEKDKKVTALYCRLSKDDGSNSESLSIRTQKAMLMEYATRNGFGNCQYYVDDGYSGTNSDRPAFQELLDDIREGKVATVITKDQSRLGRNHIETGTYMEIFFPEHGVRYIAINDGYDSNEQSQMDIAPFRNIINEMYAKDTSRKIKSALRTRKKSGKYISSNAPFGYQKDPADHNHLVIDPNTAPVVEYIYSMAEEGLVKAERRPLQLIGDAQLRQAAAGGVHPMGAAQRLLCHGKAVVGLVALDGDDRTPALGRGHGQYLVHAAEKAEHHGVVRAGGTVGEHIGAQRRHVFDMPRRQFPLQHRQGGGIPLRRRDMADMGRQRQREIAQAAACVAYRIVRMQVRQQLRRQKPVEVGMPGGIGHEADHVIRPAEHRPPLLSAR